MPSPYKPVRPVSTETTAERRTRRCRGEHKWGCAAGRRWQLAARPPATTPTCEADGKVLKAAEGAPQFLFISQRRQLRLVLALERRLGGCRAAAGGRRSAARAAGQQRVRTLRHRPRTCVLHAVYRRRALLHRCARLQGSSSDQLGGAPLGAAAAAPSTAATGRWQVRPGAAAFDWLSIACVVGADRQCRKRARVALSR